MMEIDKRIYKYPLFISYPRTGCHWINCVMELYFNKPRLREKRFTFLDSSRNDWMWFHDHDRWDRLKPHNNTLYMYRDSVDTIFSFLMYQEFEENRSYSGDYSDERVIFELDLYIKNLNKYLINPDYKARTVVKYDKFKTDRHSEFRKIVDHFGFKWSSNKCDKSFEYVSKDKMVAINKPAMNKFMISNQYEALKSEFRDKWFLRFNEIIEHNKLNVFFE